MAEVWEVDPESLTDAALAARLAELDAERCRVEAAMARAVAVADTPGRVGIRRATSGAAWLANRCELSRSSAATLVRTARRLRSMPATRGALSNGEISFAKATLLASAAHRSDKTIEVFARDEAVLVDHARQLTVDQTARCCGTGCCRPTPTARGEPRRGRQVARVSSTFAGTTVLDALYTSEDGEVVRPPSPTNTSGSGAPRGPRAARPAPPAQRRAAALAEVVRRAVGCTNRAGRRSR